jgi:hypothetical protein
MELFKGLKNRADFYIGSFERCELLYFIKKKTGSIEGSWTCHGNNFHGAASKN